MDSHPERSRGMRLLVTFLLGFSSGLPLLLTSSTLQTWMTESGVEIKSVALVAYLGLPYTLKFLWAPLFDSYIPPLLGRRRGWLVITQGALVAALLLMSIGNPTTDPVLLVVAALSVAFFSASQDIVIDAHRRDLLPETELALGSGLYVNGYRIGMLVGGAGALWLADQPGVSWGFTYRLIACTMVVGLLAALLSPEPEGASTRARTIREAVLEPLAEFFRRLPLREAAVLLLFVLLYKFGDSFASALTSPFYISLGYTKTQIATAAKVFGLVATLTGALVGGYIVEYIGLGRALWIFGVLQAVSTLGFSFLVGLPPESLYLFLVVAFENFTGAMGTSAYAAFMASLCSRSFSATQYALLSSIMAIPRTIFGGLSGQVQSAVGWELFFVVSTVAALPGLILLHWVAPWKRSEVKG